jgi:hypothetical protein
MNEHAVFAQGGHWHRIVEFKSKLLRTVIEAMKSMSIDLIICGGYPLRSGAFFPKKDAGRPRVLSRAFRGDSHVQRVAAVVVPATTWHSDSIPKGEREAKEFPSRDMCRGQCQAQVPEQALA